VPVGPSVTTSSSTTDFSFQNLVFLGNLFEFLAAEIIFKNQYLPHFESKFYQINSIKSCSSRSSQKLHPKSHSNSSKNFQLQFNLIQFSVKKSFNIQELLHSKSKHIMEPSPCTPSSSSSSSSRAFQKHQEHNLKDPPSMDLIPTKQNKLPSFIDRFFSPFNPCTIKDLGGSHSMTWFVEFCLLQSSLLVLFMGSIHFNHASLYVYIYIYTSLNFFSIQERIQNRFNVTPNLI